MRDEEISSLPCSLMREDKTVKVVWASKAGCIARVSQGGGFCAMLSSLRLLLTDEMLQPLVLH